MYKLKEGYSAGVVTCKGYCGEISEAPQSILKHLYHLGHNGIEYTKKGKKAKPEDIAINNEITEDVEENRNEEA